MITGTSTTTTTVIMTAIMTGKMITGKIASMRGNVNDKNVSITGGSARRHDNGYYRGGQVYNGYPQRYPGNAYPGGGVYSYPGGGYPSGGYGYPGSVYGRGGNGRSGAYGFGYQDGSYMARKDISQNKRFNPNPRNEYGNRTHGYNSSFGRQELLQGRVQQRIFRWLRSELSWRTRLVGGSWQLAISNWQLARSHQKRWPPRIWRPSSFLTDNS